MHTHCGCSMNVLTMLMATARQRLDLFNDYIRSIMKRQDIMKKNTSYLDGLRRSIGDLEVQKAMRYQDVTIGEGELVLLRRTSCLLLIGRFNICANPCTTKRRTRSIVAKILLLKI